MLKRALLSSLHSSTGTLDLERQDVKADEGLGQFVDGDEGVLFSVQKTHDAAKDHVNCCCEQGRGDESED